jgi:hypothetical protein
MFYRLFYLDNVFLFLEYKGYRMKGFKIFLYTYSVIFSSLISPNLFSQNSNSKEQDLIFAQLQNIDSIDSHLGQCFMDTLALEESTQLGECTIYHNNGEVEKIDRIDYGETGRRIRQYYFKERLIYVRDSIYEYSSSNNNINYNNTVSVNVIEYFIDNGKIIKTISSPKNKSNNTSIESSGEIFAEMTNILLKYDKQCFLNYRQAKHPQFEDFIVKKNFHGKPAKVNLGTNEEVHRYRTVIHDGAAEGPNFADHFTIVIWGRGTYAQEFAIVDAISGSVYIFPETISNGLMYRRNSNLLIIAPITKSDMKDYDNNLPDWLITRYYKWNGKILILIDSSRSVTNFPDEVKW